MLADSELERSVIELQPVDVAVMVDGFFFDDGSGCFDGLGGEGDEVSAQSFMDVF
jgi:hypothetical protein